MVKIFLHFKKSLSYKNAFSLLEMLISLAIFSILIVVISYIIVLNMRVANKVRARTYVREETSYLLKNLKKDIRNADKIEAFDINDDGVNDLVIHILTEGGLLKKRGWYIDGNRVKRKVIYSGGDGVIDIVTPEDLEIREFDFRLLEKPKNTIVLVKIKGWAVGLPENQSILKEVAVSTRIFEKE